MKNLKQKKYFRVIYLLGFILASFFLLYWINNYPYEYIVMAGIAIIMLIMGFMAFDGLYKEYKYSQSLRKQQNEIIIKALKAIYLLEKEKDSNKNSDLL